MNNLPIILILIVMAALVGSVLLGSIALFAKIAIVCGIVWMVFVAASQ